MGMEALGLASTSTFKRRLKIMLPARFGHLSKSAKTYRSHTTHFRKYLISKYDK